MTNNSPKEGNLKGKEGIEIAQSILNILREVSILSIFFMLITVPKFVNEKLAAAGVVEVQIGGVTWKKTIREN